MVPVGDTEKLAEKILFLLQNPQIAETMGQAAISYVKQFSAREVAEQWQNFFKKFLRN